MAKKLAVLSGMVIVIMLAAPSYAQSPGDHLAGSGSIAFTDFPSPGATTVEQIIASAHSGPSGEDPRGQITLHSPLLESRKAKAEVTCLRVTGTHAVAGGEFEEPVRYLGLMIRHVNLIVEDNGSDDMAAAFAFIDRPRPPGFSPCDVDVPPAFRGVEGNYTVRDSE